MESIDLFHDVTASPVRFNYPVPTFGQDDTIQQKHSPKRRKKTSPARDTEKPQPPPPVVENESKEEATPEEVSWLMRWMKIPPMGSWLPQVPLIAVKMPVTEAKLTRLIPAKHKFEPSTVLAEAPPISPSRPSNIGLVVDLCQHPRYNRAAWEQKGVKCVELGNYELDVMLRLFVRAVENFFRSQEGTSNSNAAVAVVCEDGFTKSGTAITYYAVENLDCSLGAALMSFSRSRPPGVFDKTCLSFLASKYSEDVPEVTPPPWALPKSGKQPRKQQDDHKEETSAVGGSSDSKELTDNSTSGSGDGQASDAKKGVIRRKIPRKAPTEETTVTATDTASEHAEPSTVDGGSSLPSKLPVSRHHSTPAPPPMAPPPLPQSHRPSQSNNQAKQPSSTSQIYSPPLPHHPYLVPVNDGGILTQLFEYIGEDVLRRYLSTVPLATPHLSKLSSEYDLTWRPVGHRGALLIFGDNCYFVFPITPPPPQIEAGTLSAQRWTLSLYQAPAMCFPQRKNPTLKLDSTVCTGELVLDVEGPGGSGVGRFLLSDLLVFNKHPLYTQQPLNHRRRVIEVDLEVPRKALSSQQTVLPRIRLKKLFPSGQAMEVLTCALPHASKGLLYIRRSPFAPGGTLPPVLGWDAANTDVTKDTLLKIQ